MRLDQNPLFRRVIVPWYDSNTACLILLFTMLVVLCFAVAGVWVAVDTPAYQGYWWLPALLLVLSLLVVVSVAVRLIKRYYAMHYSK